MHVFLWWLLGAYYAAGRASTDAGLSACRRPAGPAAARAATPGKPAAGHARAACEAGGASRRATAGSTATAGVARIPIEDAMRMVVERGCRRERRRNEERHVAVAAYVLAAYVVLAFRPAMFAQSRPTTSGLPAAAVPCAAAGSRLRSEPESAAAARRRVHGRARPHA